MVSPFFFFFFFAFLEDLFEDLQSSLVSYLCVSNGDLNLHTGLDADGGDLGWAVQIDQTLVDTPDKWSVLTLKPKIIQQNVTKLETLRPGGEMAPYYIAMSHDLAERYQVTVTLMYTDQNQCCNA